MKSQSPSAIPTIAQVAKKIEKLFTATKAPKVVKTVISNENTTESLNKKDQHKIGKVAAAMTPLTKKSPADGFVINSHVISASVRPPEALIKKDGVKIILRHKRPTFGSGLGQCVYWERFKTDRLMKEEDQKKYQTGGIAKGGFWSTKGCQTISSNRTHTICLCNHLTNFAILMDVQGVAFDGLHERNLDWITKIGCNTSIVCLILAVFGFILAPGLTSQVRTKIHINLCVNLILANFLLLSGVKNARESSLLCGLTAMGLHYLYLTAFCWMCIEGLHLYISLVKVFTVDSKSTNRWYHLLSYSIPAMIVAITFLFSDQNNPKRRIYGVLGEHCWINSQHYSRLAFVLPVSIICFLNIFFLVVALRVVSLHKAVAKKRRPVFRSGSSHLSSQVSTKLESMSSGFAYSTSSATIMSRNKNKSKNKPDLFKQTSGNYIPKIPATVPENNNNNGKLPKKKEIVTMSKIKTSKNIGYQNLGVSGPTELTMVSGQQKLDAIQQNIQKQLSQAGRWVKGSMVLICLLGVTWIIGIFYVSKGTIFFAYAFTIVNSLQGMFIFLFHCLLNEKIRFEILKKMNIHEKFTADDCCLLKLISNSTRRRKYNTNFSSSGGGGKSNVSNKTFSSGMSSSINERSLNVSDNGLVHSLSIKTSQNPYDERSPKVRNRASAMPNLNLQNRYSTMTSEHNNNDEANNFNNTNSSTISNLILPNNSNDRNGNGNDQNLKVAERYNNNQRRHTNYEMSEASRKIADPAYTRQYNIKKYKFKMELEKSWSKKNVKDGHKGGSYNESFDDE